jgi:hypothetical protein
MWVTQFEHKCSLLREDLFVENFVVERFLHTVSVVIIGKTHLW